MRLVHDVHINYSATKVFTITANKSVRCDGRRTNNKQIFRNNCKPETALGGIITVDLGVSRLEDPESSQVDFTHLN